MNIILLGAPGSGKGTQSELLVTRNNFTHVSTGDLMREEIKNGTKLGQECEGYIKAGKLVPDDIVNQIVGEYLKTNHDNLIFDGYPRTIQQAEELDKMLEAVHSKIDYVFYIDVEKKVLLDRISGRWVCPKCKRSYHITNRPPKVAGLCDFDGTKLVRRPDDEPAKVRVRLEAYEKETKPLVEYYKKLEKIIHVNSKENNEPPLVYKQIVKTLEGK